MVYCENCKWFAIHFLSDANRNIQENPLCIDGQEYADGDHYCKAYKEIQEE